jgi:hypothetical protein
VRNAPSNVEEEALRGHISGSKSTSLSLSIDDEVVGVLLRVGSTKATVSKRDERRTGERGGATNELMETLSGTETTVDKGIASEICSGGCRVRQGGVRRASTNNELRNAAGRGQLMRGLRRLREPREREGRLTTSTDWVAMAR